jgi:hypothetical protein
MEVSSMDTPPAELTDVAPDVARLPRWLIVAAVVLATTALWLVAFDNGQASAMVDTTGTALHELFHDGRHLMGAPCH